MRVAVDFSDRTDDGLLVSVEGGDLRVGDKVIAYDDRGNEAPSSVVSITDKGVWLSVDWYRFKWRTIESDWEQYRLHRPEVFDKDVRGTNG